MRAVAREVYRGHHDVLVPIRGIRQSFLDCLPIQSSS